MPQILDVFETADEQFVLVLEVCIKGTAPESMSNAAAPDFVVHDFVHIRRAYSGFGGSSVRMFAVSYVE